MYNSESDYILGTKKRLNSTLRSFGIGIELKRSNKGSPQPLRSLREGEKWTLVGYKEQLRPTELLSLPWMCGHSHTHG
jgi:hypothetical protein